MKGLLVVLSGPSGVGKDTVIDAWVALDPEIRKVITCTTRAPRAGETDGVDYIFLTEAEFAERAAAGRFLEHKLVHGHHYATPADETDNILAEGHVALLKIDVQGGLTVKDLRPDAFMLFLAPPSPEELERRIRDRATDAEADIERRLANARGEMAMAGRYEHVVVNDQVERAARELEEIVAAERRRRGA
jgi:guanylate kinase